MIYVGGSLRNPKIPEIANELQKATGERVFADWHGAGPKADDHLREYEIARNPASDIRTVLKSALAKSAFDFDKKHIDEADTFVLVMPAGRSGFLELGYALGKGKRGYVLFDGEPERWDIMLLFCNGVALSIAELVEMLMKIEPKRLDIWYPVEV
jgi:hypothetical protein